MKKSRYSAAHLAFLRRGYARMNSRDLARAFTARFGLDRTESQIRSALKNHKIRCGRSPKERLASRLRIYTPEQAAFIRDNYPGRGVAELTALFNARFGAGKTERQIKTFVHNRGITSGRTGRFEKGNRPWNAGTRGQKLTGPNRGSFKKGSAPPNRKPLGAERICKKDGFVLVKVAEKNPYTGFATRYKHKHVHVWEKSHGPVPEGKVVAFRDGNKRNCALGNLMLLSRAELLRLNRHRYKEAPGQIKPSVLALARLEVKTFQAMKQHKEAIPSLEEYSK